MGSRLPESFWTFDSDALLILQPLLASCSGWVQGPCLHYLVKPYPENEISDLIDEVLSGSRFRKIHRDIKVNGSNVQVPFRHIIRRTFFPYDPYSHHWRQRTDHPPVLKLPLLHPENGSKILSLQQRRCDRSGACC